MSRAAIRYAKAILDTAQSKGVAADVNNDMAHIAENIASNAELKEFIHSPTINNIVKEKALLEVFDAASPVTKGMLHLLHENKRFGILGHIAAEYNRLFQEMNGVQVAKVTTAVPLDAAMESKVMAKILEFSNKKIVVENIVDPEIIGGFILRIGDQQYNASVANRLQVLKREFNN